MDVVTTEDIKTEVFEVENVKKEDMTIQEEEFKSANRFFSGIVVDYGILDFDNEDVIPEMTITEGEYYVDQDVEEGSEVTSSTEQNHKIIEEIKSKCTGELNNDYLLPLIKEENESTENSTLGHTSGEKANPSEVRNVGQSLSRKTNNKSSLYCQSGRETHRPLQCNRYEYLGDRKTDLKIVTHILMKKKPFDCTECSSRFIRKFDLAKHIQAVHLKEKPFGCTECKYFCSRKRSLVVHIQAIHLKEKLFRCTKCEYSSCQKSNLETHVQSVHLNKKPFRCTKCEYSCCQKTNLETHVQSVHLKEKPFRCAECEFSCSQKSHLNRHVRTVHLKEKPFRCTECGNSFSKKSILSTHYLLVHKTGTHGVDNVASKISQS